MQSLLQTQAWADLKVAQGWHSHEVEGLFVLEKALPFAPKGSLWEKSFLYAPEVTFADIKNLENFLQKIKEICEKSRAIFFRLEIIDKKNVEIIENLKKNGFTKSFEELQPEWRQIVDISKTEEEILSQMKPKGRYNIKIAEKHGVKVEKTGPEDLLEGVDIFYNLFLQTGKNQGFSVRPKKYFQDLLFKLYAKDYADLLIARFENIPVASLMITYYDEVASYLYGASSKDYRNVMAPYLLHWEAIKIAKEKGYKTYDLLAVAPENIENHKYAGITRFKEQFGGEKVNIVGSYDLVLKPTWYKMFKAAEKYRRK